MNKKTHLLLPILPAVILVSAFLPTVVSARMMETTELRQTTSVGTMRVATGSAKSGERVEERKEVRQEAKMGMMESSADREIERRIEALNRVTTRVNNMSRISADQKTNLLNEIQTASSDLNALKIKIDADTDPATLKADKQSIVTSYRVFLLLIPKVEIMAHADVSLQVARQMAADNSTIQTKITTAQTAGKDVTEANKLLADRTTKIADAQAKAQSIINSISSLTPEGYPANKTTLLEARDTMKTVREDLKTAFQDLVKINASLK